MSYTKPILQFQFDDNPERHEGDVINPRKVVIRETSRQAHNSIKEHKQAIYDKIVKALEQMKVGGNFEEIALVAGIRPDQSHKRLAELVQKRIVFNVGITRPTSSGRASMVRQLCSLK